MEVFTLTKGFKRQNVIDEFKSIIWTERYYGDSDVQIIVPPKPDLLEKLPLGIFLVESESSELMILETVEDDGDDKKFTGISLLSWMNNRFLWLPSSVNWPLVDVSPGLALWEMIFGMVCEDSPILADSGFDSYRDRVKIPQLGLHSYDDSGDLITMEVAFGPLYDAMKSIAQSYQVGMQIVLEMFDDTGNPIGFRSYRGADRTTGNLDGNRIIRLSEDLGSLAGSSELHSIGAYKNLAVTGTSTPAAWVDETDDLSGFDLRVLWLDPSTDNSQAREQLLKYPKINAVDGQIISAYQAEYGVDYKLGDIVELEGKSGTITTGRITEHIHSQDDSGEKKWQNRDTVQ